MPQLTPFFFVNQALFNFIVLYIMYVFTKYLLPRFVRLFKTRLHINNLYHNKLSFAPYYIFKDLIVVFIFFIGLLIFVFFIPNILDDNENYLMANSMQTQSTIVAYDIISLFKIYNISYNNESIFLYIIYLISILCVILMVIKKNSYVSGLYLIILFADISCYFMFIGLNFIGLSHASIFLIYVLMAYILIKLILIYRRNVKDNLRDFKVKITLISKQEKWNPLATQNFIESNYLYKYYLFGAVTKKEELLFIDMARRLNTVLNQISSKSKSKSKSKNTRKFFTALNKIYGGSLILSALLLKAANGELNSNETRFIYDGMRIATWERESHILKVVDNYRDHRVGTELLADDFYSELTIFIEQTTGNQAETLESIKRLILSNLNGRGIRSDIYDWRIENAPEYYIRSGAYKIQTVKHCFTHDKLIDARIDDYTNYYFALWNKNFSILEPAKNSLYSLYNAYRQARLERDKWGTELIKCVEGRLESKHSEFINNVCNANRLKFKYSEIIDESKKIEIKCYQDLYKQWFSQEKYEFLMNKIIYLQEKNIINLPLDLKGIKFTSLTYHTHFYRIEDTIQLNKFEGQSVPLDVGEINTIINSLIEAGIIQG